ncbi:MAG: zinc-ribbon domain-containing protein [Ktedonobacteraceae bacterium]
MKHCASCGTEIPDSARYCRQCGQVLSEQKPLAEETMQQPALSLAAHSSGEGSARITGPLAAHSEQGQDSASVATIDALAPESQTQSSAPEANLAAPTENADAPTALADLPDTDLPEDTRHLSNGNIVETPVSSLASELPTSKLVDAKQPTDVHSGVDEQEPGVVSGAEQQLTSSAASAPSETLTPSPASESPDALTPLSVSPTSTQSSRQRRRSSVVTRIVVGIIIFALIVAGAGAFIIMAHPFSQGTAATPLVAPSPTTDNNTAPASGVTVCPGSTSSGCLTPSGTRSSVSSSKVNLAFADAVTGQMTAITVGSCGVEPSLVAGQQYHLSVLGTVNGQRYGFALIVYPYTSPNIYTNSVSSFFGPAGDNSSLTQWRSSGSTGMNVTVNSDNKSGTLDINLSNASDHSTVHVTGNWTCA